MDTPGEQSSGHRHGEAADQPQNRLAAAELGFGMLFWATHDVVIVGDAATGQVVLANPAASRLFGYEDHEFVGLPIERLVSDELRQGHLRGVAAYVDNGHGLLIDAWRPVEVAARRKDGTGILIELSLTPLQTNDGGRHLVAAIARDISERRRLGAERATVLAAAQDYARRLEELSSLKAGFTAMVAHELITPISAIRGLSDLLLTDQLHIGQRPASIEAIRAEVDLLLRLAADIQSAATMEGDGFAVRLSPTAAVSVLADASAFARMLSTGHPFVAEIDDEAAAATVMADPGRIKQVLRNLLGNAAKHTPAGTPMTLRASCVDGKAWNEVADRGPGIPLQDVEHIFEKFGRGRDAEGWRVPGAGLGLYLSRWIVRAHGGELSVASGPEGGDGLRFLAAAGVRERSRQSPGKVIVTWADADNTGATCPAPYVSVAPKSVPPEPSETWSKK